MGYEAKPMFKLTPQPSWSNARRFMHKLVTNPKWEKMVQSLVLANTVVLCVTWYAQPATASNILRKVNYAFIAIGTTTVSCVLFAFRKDFFRLGWRNLDLFVVVTSLLLLGIQKMGWGEFAVQSMIIRTFRLARLFRALRNTKTLQLIMSTLAEAAPSCGSLGMLMILLMLIYAIIGMKLFGKANTTEQTTLDYHCNFKNIFNAFLLLVRCGTGEAWNQVMFDLARQKSVLF